MRKPRHFSPTSFDLYEKDKEAYYTQYLSDRRFERDPQTVPMGIGSAFDFLVKEHLTVALKDKLVPGAKIGKMSDQVEKHNLAECSKLGTDVMALYTASGALDALKREIVADARFEFGVTGAFVNGKLVEAAPEIPRNGSDTLLLNGRPDAHYYTRTKFTDPLIPVIHDWKVNGWQSTTKSPDPGYVALHGADGSVHGHHKDAFLTFFNGVRINGAKTLIPNSWQKQISIYGWVLGVEIGAPIIGSIDQVIGPAAKGRVAKHRFVIGEEFQCALYKRIEEAWEVVNSGWLFREMSREQSINRCVALDNQVIHESWMEGMRER